VTARDGGLGWTTAQTKDKRGMVDEREIPTIIRSLGVNPTQVRCRSGHAMYALTATRTCDSLESGGPARRRVHTAARKGGPLKP
jgi:hypothetical protein